MSSYFFLNYSSPFPSSSKICQTVLSSFFQHMRSTMHEYVKFKLYDIIIDLGKKKFQSPNFLRKWLSSLPYYSTILQQLTGEFFSYFVMKSVPLTGFSDPISLKLLIIISTAHLEHFSFLQYGNEWHLRM